MSLCCLRVVRVVVLFTTGACRCVVYDWCMSLCCLRLVRVVFTTGACRCVVYDWCVSLCCLQLVHVVVLFTTVRRCVAGDVHEAQVRADEEGVRAERAVRLRDRAHHLHEQQQAVPVRQLRHGQGAAQVHRVQRHRRQSDQQGHPRGTAHVSLQ